MNKIESPSSNNSRTSSETSETQSVEENISITSNEQRGEAQQQQQQQAGNALVDRAAKKTKRMKDANDKEKDEKDQRRPPWRAVSLSTLPKPDKNALLKAKLLDASRRLRQGKSTAATQTEIEPTKLMKEVNLGTQVDLILLREASVMTDGSYMKRKEGGDEFILTYSVSTLTDDIQFNEKCTQTLLPKYTEDNFMKAYRECDLNALHSKDFSEVQRKLLQQIWKIKKRAKRKDCAGHADTAAVDAEDTQTMLRRSAQYSLLKVPTLKSWHFELDDIGGADDLRTFQPYTICPNRPWQSFKPLELNNLYSDANVNHRLDWNILLIAIDELIQESNNLIDLIEDKQQVESIEIAPKLPKLIQQPLQMPSEYWLPIVEQQEAELDEMMKNLKSMEENRSIANS